MFDPRDFTPDPRRTITRPRRDLGVEREQRRQRGHRREYDPRTEHQTFEGRVRRAVTDVGMYRSRHPRPGRSAFRWAPLRGEKGRGPHGSRRTRPGAYRPWTARRHLEGAHAHRARSGARGGDRPRTRTRPGAEGMERARETRGASRNVIRWPRTFRRPRAHR